MPETKRPLKVFLCHASTDKAKVRELYRYLKKRGIQPWFDEEDLVGGQDWQVEIPKALATSDAIIICLTKNSVDKEGYIQKEIKFALDKALEMPEGRIFLIPVKFEECEVPFSLSRYQWVDLTVESGYAKMMKSLKFRASQLERSTVELPKKDVEENFAREKKEREAAELAKEKELREKQARDASEKAKGDAEESEQAEQERKRKLEKLLNENNRRLETAKRKYKWDMFFLNIRHRLRLFFIDVRFKFLPILFGLIAVSAFVFMMFYIQKIWPILTINEVNPTSQPSQSLTDTINPTNTVTVSPLLTEPSTSTATSLPTEITDTKGGIMVLVKAGEFTMGSDEAEKGFADCEAFYVNPICNLEDFLATEPEHVVYLDDFWIDQTEVTNGMYAKCVQDGYCERPRGSTSSSRRQENYYGSSKYENYPVIYVSWDDANNYCKWAHRRLPTEAEWEKAARGTDGRAYPWGENINCNLANYNKCELDTTSVDSYPSGKSFYGAFNMVGNVWEWVADWYSETYYANSPKINPTGPESGQDRVARGGSYESQDFVANATYRQKVNPSYENGDGWVSNDFGFRCARDTNQ